MIGGGILKGLGVTAKNLVGSFHDPKRLVTVEYPEERNKLPENARQFPFLVYDGDEMIDGLRCVACRICEKECPPQCIYIVLERDANGKPMKRPKVFDIDISVCMSCQICVEVCPFDAIEMNNEFELATDDRFEGLLLHREDLAKPNSYFHEVHPATAAEVDARLAGEKRKAEEKAKAAAAARAAAAAKAAAAKAAAETKTDPPPPAAPPAS
ncbi:MAG: 4Fe-4S dicluster domain-containing protein [Opitutaceae bacterium]